ncbi:MAG: hypothetical protein IKF17_05245 [Clostridia bacterium]|nr:hypothetical protein [Clostridia bacterium]
MITIMKLLIKLLIKLLKTVFIILLTVMIIGIAAIKILSSTILDEAYVFRKLRSSNYYDSIYQELKSNFENYIGPSGLEESVLDDICTVEDIQNDTETILGNIYEGTNKKVDTTAIQERLKNNIEKSLNQLKETKQADPNIDQFVEEISNEYINTISHTDYEEKLNNVYQKAIQIIKIGKIGLWIASIIIIILLIVLNIKSINRALANIGISFASAGAFIISGYYILMYNIRIEHLRVLNNSISMAFQEAIREIFNNINSAGIIIGIIGIVLIILGNILKKDK